LQALNDICVNLLGLELHEIGYGPGHLVSSPLAFVVSGLAHRYPSGWSLESSSGLSSADGLVKHLNDFIGLGVGEFNAAGQPCCNHHGSCSSYLLGSADMSQKSLWKHPAVFCSAMSRKVASRRAVTFISIGSSLLCL